MRDFRIWGLLLAITVAPARADDARPAYEEAVLPEPTLVIQPRDLADTAAVVAQDDAVELPAFDPDATDAIPKPDAEAIPSLEAPGESDWVVEIVPAPRHVVGGDRSPAAQYRELYDSIPFSRAEWLANASYRHDSAMALLTGQPINGRTAPNRNLEEYQDPRNYRRTFFPRLSPADIHYQYGYGVRYGRFGYRWWAPFRGTYGY